MDSLDGYPDSLDDYPDSLEERPDAKRRKYSNGPPALNSLAEFTLAPRPSMEDQTPLPSDSIMVNCPPEMHLTIASFLDGLDLLSLRLTKRYFRELIAPPTIEALVEAEKTQRAATDNLLACRGCNRLRSSSGFEKSMKEHTRVRGGFNADIRFCVCCSPSISPKGPDQYVIAPTHRENILLVKQCESCAKLAARMFPYREILFCGMCYKWPTKEMQESNKRKIEEFQLNREKWVELQLIERGISPRTAKEASNIEQSLRLEYFRIPRAVPK